MSAARKLAMFDPEGDSAGPPPLRSDVATVAQILDWYGEATRGKLNPHSEFECARIRRLFAGEYGKLKCVDARPHNLLAFINAHLEGKSAWTIKRWNGCVQRPFNFAVKMGLLLHNPFKGLTFAAGSDGRDWTDRELAAVLRTLNPNQRRFFTFMRFSGMRPGEVRNLKWSDIKLEIEAIVILKHKTAAKTRLPRRIPLNSVLLKLLVYQRDRVPISSAHVFLNAFGRPWSMPSLNKMFRRCRLKAALPREVKPHGARHTFATRAVMNGVDVATLAQLLGHADLKTTNRYMHLAGKNEHLNAAMEIAIQCGRKKATKTRPEESP